MLWINRHRIPASPSHLFAKGKPISRFILATLLSLLLISVATAQTELSPRRSCRDCIIKREYDRLKNQTHITLKPLPVATVNDAEMSLSVVAGFKGQRSQGADCVYLIAIIFNGKTTHRASDTKLTALVNGKRESFGSLMRTGDEAGNGRQTVTYSKLTDREIISKIGRAEKVEMRFGETVFQLTPDQQAALRDFLDELDDAPLRRRAPELHATKKY